jgi:glycosyltransferase involved in cell wall biosynthesis
MTGTGRQLRLACFGWVAADAGSCVTGHFLTLKALLERGHRIDLFGERGVVDPAELRDLPGYRFHELPERLVTRWVHRTRRGSVARTAFNMATNPLFARTIRAAVRAEHGLLPFDALVFLGVSACCRVDGLPVVEWVQGSPWEEAAAFRRQRRMLVDAIGRFRYQMYSSYYWVDAVVSRAQQVGADLTICGSEWCRRSLVAHGYEPDRVATMAYPVDVDRFELPVDSPARDFTILHLGRLDPRKRPDLLVEAFRRVVATMPQARLLVVGRPGVIQTMPHVLSAPDLADRVTYLPGVPADEVPGLFRQADVLVQVSESENFGSAVAEAMLAGLPVVVGPTNGTAQYIDSASLQFADYTAESVADALLAVARSAVDGNPAERAARRRFAIDQFSPMSAAARFEDLVGQAVDRHAEPGAQWCGSCS